MIAKLGRSDVTTVAIECGRRDHDADVAFFAEQHMPSPFLAPYALAWDGGTIEIGDQVEDRYRENIRVPDGLQISVLDAASSGALSGKFKQGGVLHVTITDGSRFDFGDYGSGSHAFVVPYRLSGPKSNTAWDTFNVQIAVPDTIGFSTTSRSTVQAAIDVIAGCRSNRA